MSCGNSWPYWPARDPGEPFGGYDGHDVRQVLSSAANRPEFDCDPVKPDDLFVRRMLAGAEPPQGALRRLEAYARARGDCV